MATPGEPIEISVDGEKALSFTRLFDVNRRRAYR